MAHDVFISHVEGDADVALGIALGLEQAGFSTWCYELDSVAGVSYLLQTKQAIERSGAVVVIVSAHSLGSSQMTKEIVRAHESGKHFAPVLRGITHAEFQARQPEWREAIGAATSIVVPAQGVAEILPRVVDGLRALGVRPRKRSDAARVAAIQRQLAELAAEPVPRAPPLPPVGREPEPQPMALRRTYDTIELRGSRHVAWLVAALGILVVVVLVAVFLRVGPLSRYEGGRATATPNAAAGVSVTEASTMGTSVATAEPIPGSQPLTDTLAVLATIPTGDTPISVAVNPNTNRIYIANANSVSVIDGASNSVVATLTVGVRLGPIAANPSTNRIYVASLGDSNVSVIDGVSNSVVATIPMGMGSEPWGVDADPSTNRIYVTVLSAGGESVSVIDGASNLVVATIPISSSALGVAVNPSTNRIYIVNDDSNYVSVIDRASNTVVVTVPVGSVPRGVAVNPSTNGIYVTNYNSANVSVIDGSSNAVVATVPVGLEPWGVAVNPSTNRIYVANGGSNNVSAIDGATNTVAAVVDVGGGPRGVAVDPTINRIYVANNGDGTVSVISDE